MRRIVGAIVVGVVVVGGRVLDLTERPEQVGRLERWLSDFMTDPRIHAVAVWTANAIVFLNQWWVETILIAVILLLLFWGVRPIWRIRHRVIFFWRRSLEAEVWTTKANAIELIRKSNLATSRSKNPWASLFIGGLDRKFDRWCEMVLESFISNNPNYIRSLENGESEYREDKLRTFLRRSFDDDVLKEYGSIPSKSV
jgi:hypothetical protein